MSVMASAQLGGGSPANVYPGLKDRRGFPQTKTELPVGGRSLNAGQLPITVAPSAD